MRVTILLLILALLGCAGSTDGAGGDVSGAVDSQGVVGDTAGPVADVPADILIEDADEDSAGWSDIGWKPDSAGESLDSALEETTDAADSAPMDVSSDGGPDDGGPLDAGSLCSPPAPAPPLGPSGYPMDGWGWVSHGVILEDPAAGANEGLLAPALVERGGVLHLFYTRKVGTVHRIWHAASTDGETWTGATEVTGLGDDPVLAYPAVLVEDGRFRMWVGSGTFDLAESDDGVAWTIVAESVLRPSDVGGFGALSLLYPTVARTPAGYAMWFTGYDGAQLRIGRATSPDGVAWTVSPKEPVLSPGDGTDFDNKAVAGPSALRIGEQWFLWYGGYDTSKTNPGPYRVGLAASADGVAWQKVGVSLDLPAAGPDAWSTRDPAVLPGSGGWLMIYAGLGTDQRYRLLRATSAVCTGP